MSVISEEVLYQLLSTGLKLSQKALMEMQQKGANSGASPEILKEYTVFLEKLQAQKNRDVRLADESWEWIWKIKNDLNAIQLYGRLAWLNYSLHGLL